MFPHRDIKKYALTSPDGKTRNQIDHVLIDRRWHSVILFLRSSRGADCDTHNYLVVTKVRERLAVSKLLTQKYTVERYNPRKLNELEVRKQYHLEISNRLAASENFIDSKDIYRAWENIKENIKISAKESINLYELKQHLP